MSFDNYRNSDPGDKYDPFKWDFDESKLKTYKINGYIYKLRPESDNNKLKLLIDIRDKINKVSNYIHNNMNKFDSETHNGLKLFVRIHGEVPTTDVKNPFKEHWMINNGITSHSMYHEIPKNTGFWGLNKPKNRHINNNVPYIGKDKNLRPGWREVFLELDRSKQDIIDLVIHEISHTAANHSRWRNDDHGKDFQMYEKIIKNVWNST